MALASVVASAGCFRDQVAGAPESASGGSSTPVDPSAGDSSAGDPSRGPSGDGSTLGDPSPTSGRGSDDSGGSTTAMLDGGSSTGGRDDGSSDESSTSRGETTGESTASVEDLSPGDLVITEVMANPHCDEDFCEWFELYNATALTVNLLGLLIQDGDYSGAFEGEITEDVLIEPGGLVVLARSLEGWPYAFDPDFVYGPHPGLTNGSPERVVVLSGEEILDETSLFFDLEQGRAWSLSSAAIDAVANNDSDFWCDAVTPLPAGFYDEFGTPGATNPPC